MKVEQLMINDLVTVVVTESSYKTNQEKTSRRYARVTDISPNCCMSEYMKDDCTLGINLFEELFDLGDFDYTIEPIPLTEEILNANEWYNNGHDYYTYGGDLPRTNLWLIEKVLNESDVIESVHELQHLLRLCKREDMADNFKLE